MKSPQTPTLHVREVLRRRAGVERFGLAFMSPVPTVEAVATNVDVVERPGRAWGIVEVVSPADEAPGAVVLDHTRHAIRGVVGRGGRVFVFVPRRGYAPAWRCAACGSFRRCEQCGSGGGRGPRCERCDVALGVCLACGGDRFVPVGIGVGRVTENLRRMVDPALQDRLVVGTERDLVGLAAVDLAVAVDVDRMLLAPHYRAAEDTLRVLARVAGALAGRGGGRRCIVETDLVDHPVITALRSGHAMEFLVRTAVERRAAGFPPAGDLLAIESTNAPPTAGADLVAAVGERGQVLGPAAVRDRTRWLVQGRDLSGVKAVLRGVIHEWREGGATVRIDADPTDL